MANEAQARGHPEFLTATGLACWPSPLHAEKVRNDRFESPRTSPPSGLSAVPSIPSSLTFIQPAQPPLPSRPRHRIVPVRVDRP